MHSSAQGEAATRGGFTSRDGAAASLAFSISFTPCGSVADVAFIAHDGAVLSGSGVAIGLQSKGTAVIQRADLQPLDNLELFGMSPLYSLESYRAMGRNAAGYALGKRVGPVPTQLDNFARAKLIVRTTLLHARETTAVRPGAPPVEVELAGVETVPA